MCPPPEAPIPIEEDVESATALTSVTQKDSPKNPSEEKEKNVVEGDEDSSKLSPSNWLSFSALLHKEWVDCPPLFVQFVHMGKVVDIPVKHQSEVPNFFAVGWKGIKNIGVVGQIFPQFKMETKKFNAMAPSSGVIRPATMTLVLSPPGHGKSTFLKGLAGRLHNNPNGVGKVLYNGFSMDTLSSMGVKVNRLSSFVGQSDIHYPLLTVRETLKFAVDCSVAPADLLGNPHLTELDSQRPHMMESFLGIEECKDTIIGNDLMRGVSGGQKKRVSVGEMLIQNGRILLLDQMTDGLDAAISQHIIASLRKVTRITKQSVVTALNQPTPEVFHLFDDIILMRDGEIIYHGEKDGVAEFFKTYLGVEIPEEADIAGFIVDYLADPVNSVRNLHRLNMMKQRKLHEEGKSAETQKTSSKEIPADKSNRIEVAPIRKDSQEGGDIRINFHADDGAVEVEMMKLKSAQSNVSLELADWTPPKDGKIPFPALTTHEILRRYHASPWYQTSQTLLKDSLALCENDPKLSLNPSRWSEYTKLSYASSFPRHYYELFKIDVVRQRVLMWRNKPILIPRVMQAIFNGIIYGTLFYQLPLEGFQPKMGLLMYVVMYSAFSNLAELPSSADARVVITKQVDGGFCSVPPFIFANIWWSIPRILLEAAFFGTMMYWISGFSPDAGRFFFFELILCIASLALGQFFRTISFMASNPDVARQLDFPFILIFVIFGGFLIVPNKIPNWLIWVYWIDPMGWGVRSLAQNEFEDNRYNGLNADGIRLGDSYLKEFGLELNPIFKWMGFIYLVGFFLIFTALSSIALYKYRGAEPLGTRRLAALSEIAAKKKEETFRNKQLSGQDIKEADFAEEEEKGVKNKNDMSVEQLRAVELAMSGGSSKAGSKGLQMNSLPFVPVTLAWRNIQYTVYIGKEKKPKKLLNGISGYVKPGQLIALMGSSGAGKTTLMDVIAGRKTMGLIEGEILVNGHPKESTTFNRLSGYVEQQDLHMGLHTIEEALHFSAKLRLPASVTVDHRTSWVNQVMELVGITRIAGRLIGDAATAGISPGQLKLLTIAVELVANPSVLFLDEPTSGISSTEGLRVMKAIRRVADTGRSVVCTIHQPSAEMFFMFDRLLLLKSGGDEVYFDDIGVNGQQLIQYFERVGEGKVVPCPIGQNPSAWALDVIAAGVQTAEGGGIHTEGFEYADYANIWQQSPECLTAKKNTEECSQPSAELDARVAQVKDQEYIGWTPRFLELTKRYYIMHWRNAPTNLTRVVLCTIIGIMLGLIYFNITPNDFAGVQSMMSAIFMGMAFPASISAASAFPSFFRQRAVYYRETTVGMYDFIAYSTAMTLVELPFIFLGIGFFMFPFYWMVGLAADANLFFKMWLVLYMMAICYSFLSQLWMAVAASSIAANVLNGFFMGLFFIFGGIFIPKSSMPIGWVWFYYLDPLPKALISASLPQFYHCVEENNCAEISIPNQSVPKNSYEYVRDLEEGSVDSYWQMIGWLILSALSVRALNLLALKKISHLKR